MNRALLLSMLLFACSQSTTPNVEVSDAWARATASGQRSGAVYATIANSGGGADRLVGVATDRATMAMVHENSTANGVVRMRMVDGVDIPGGSRAEFTPGETHIMLEDLRRPLVAGERFEVRLRFENSGEKIVPVQVVAAGAR